MTALVTRAVCGVLVLLVSGTPTALLACAASCLPGMRHGVTAAPMSPATPHQQAQAAVADDAVHAHDHVAAAGPAAVAAQPAPFAPGHSVQGAVAGAAAHGCCPNTLTPTTTTVALAGVRADGLVAAGVMHTAPAAFHLARATRVAAAGVTSAAPRPRSRTPLVLRI